MTNETKALEEQIELLKKLVDTQERLIVEMRKNQPIQHVISPFYGPITICQHEYPFLWSGTGSPPCKKCGMLMNSGSITVTNTDGKNTGTVTLSTDGITLNSGTLV